MKVVAQLGGNCVEILDYLRLLGAPLLGRLGALVGRRVLVALLAILVVHVACRVRGAIGVAVLGVLPAQAREHLIGVLMEGVDARRVDLCAHVDGASDHLEVGHAAHDLLVEHDVAHVVDELELKGVLHIDFLHSTATATTKR